MFNRFLEDQKCIHNLLFGFRKKNIPQNNALIENKQKNIRKIFTTKKYACGIFIELQKAFDTVNQ